MTTTRRTTTISTTRSVEKIVVFGLGSNLGTPEPTLRQAIGLLAESLGSMVTAPFYRSQPISPIPQPDYLNTVTIAPLPAAGGSPLVAARELLAHLKELERQAGRGPGVRYGPRPLDIDLLFYGDLVHQDPEPPAAENHATAPLWLTLPHPRLRQRRFVLAPLNDLLPSLALPPDGALVHDLLAKLGDDQPVTRLC